MNNKFKELLSIENRTKYFAHALGFLSVIAVLVFFLMIFGSSKPQKENEVSVKKSDPFENMKLEGKAAVVWDVINQRELFSTNEDLPLPLASITKVMTAVTADAMLPPSSKVQIIQEFLEPEGDSKLMVGDTWESDDLRDFTLITSSNDGALALAATAESNILKDSMVNANTRAQFIKLMNDTAQGIGLSNSRFFNEHGLDREADRGGAYGSAKDMAILFEYTLKNHPQILEATRYKNLQFASAAAIYNAENTNVYLDKIPGLIASKTGYTDLAGGNLVVAFDAGLNRPIIISVLGSTQEGRFTDTLKLVEASLKEIQQD